jgi:hypothetical protein
MANLLNGFLDNVVSGLGNPKGTLGDFQHAARLYNSQAMRLAPKGKWMYHVVFNINPSAIISSSFDVQKYGTAINMLVKTIDLPKFKISVDRPQQYNRKKAVQTKLEYNDISLTFHDDNLGLTTGMWTMYYGYYYGDSKHSGSAGTASSGGFLSGMGNLLGTIAGTVPGVNTRLGAVAGLLGSSASGVPAAYQRNTTKGETFNKFRYGLDNGSSVPFFTSIQIYQLARHTYQSYTLINPIITQWSHESLNASSSESSQNSMSIAYEAVIYGQGQVKSGDPAGFGTTYYDKMPSPLSLLGGGVATLFGTAGVLGGLGSILNDIGSGNFNLGTIAKGINVARNLKSLSKEGLRQEGFNILKSAIGASAGIDVSGVANVLFPKRTGNGQNQKTPAAAPVSTVQQKTPAQRAAAFTKNPAALASLTNLAVSSGVVPSGAAAKQQVADLISAGNSTKLNGLADKIISTTG